jgi:shikimate dehydrogenase
MHNAGYRALGLPFVYVPFKTDDLQGATRGMRALGIRGLGVSAPFKIRILEFLDNLHPLARRIGAVNTVVNDDGLLTGHNTDVWGAVAALREAMDPNGKRILVIGAGGAARAVVRGLVEEGAVVHVVNRTPQRAEELAEEVSAVGPAAVTWAGLADLAKLGEFDALVNASSAGMPEYGPASLVEERAIPPGLVVMDIVYKPVHTELLQVAERAGGRVLHGGRMLLHQACRQFELYTGHPAPIAAMDAALEQAIRSQT